MELRHLRYFVAVAEEQNVTRAAARLHVSQPTLSRQIRDLEDQLGIALFERGAKAVRLNEAGRVFLTEARIVLERAEDAVRMAKAVAGGKRGEIHVGYAPSLTVELLPRALRYFRQSNPGVRVQLHDLSTREMLLGLREGKLQVALLVQVSPKALAGLVFEELECQPVCVAAHPAHPLVRARRVGLEQVAKEHLVAFTVADYPEHRAWIDELFRPLNRSPQIVEEHDSITSLIAAVESGRGVAVIAQPLNGLGSPRLKIRQANESLLIEALSNCGGCVGGGVASASKTVKLHRGWRISNEHSYGGQMSANSSTALITGGTSGIGRAAANKLAQLGIHVIVVGRDGPRGEKAVAEIRGAGGKADFISSDLRGASRAREVARKAIELGNGRVDILINNAGIYPFGPTHETSEESFDRVYSLNVKVPYFLVAELAPLMAKRGKGAIINLSTMVADYGAAGMALYGSSKSAVKLLTKAWAAEYGPSGVRVNAVSPGPTRTEGTGAMGEGLEQLAAQAPAGRPATADEIAEAIVFLATDRASFIHGAILPVDGGRSAT